MKNVVIILYIISLSLSSLLLNGGIDTCEAESSPIIHSYENHKERNSENNNEIDLRDASNKRYRILAISIRQNLIQNYNNLDNMGLETDYLTSIETHEGMH